MNNSLDGKKTEKSSNGDNCINSEVDSTLNTSKEGVFSVIENVSGNIVSGNNKVLYKEVLGTLIKDDEINISTYGNYLGFIIDFLKKNKDKIAKCNLFLGNPNMSFYQVKNNETYINKDQVKKYISTLRDIESLGFVKIYFSLKNHAKFISTKNMLFLGSQNIFTKKEDHNIENGFITKDRDNIDNYIKDFEKIFLEDESCISFSDIEKINFFYECIFDIDEIVGEIDLGGGWSNIDEDKEKDLKDKNICCCNKLEKKIEELNLSFNGFISINSYKEKIYNIFGKKLKENTLFTKFLTDFIKEVKELLDSLEELDNKNLSEQGIREELSEKLSYAFSNLEDLDNQIEGMVDSEFEKRIEAVKKKIDTLNGYINLFLKKI